MASGFTNKGSYRILGVIFRAEVLPTNFYIALCTVANTPTFDTNVMSDLVQCPDGNGYDAVAGGYILTPGGTDFDVWTEDDVNDRAFIQIKDLVWTAAGGNLPISGTGARWAVLTDDNATVADREVWAFCDLVSNRIVSDTQTLTLQDITFRFQEV